MVNEKIKMIENEIDGLVEAVVEELPNGKVGVALLVTGDDWGDNQILVDDIERDIMDLFDDVDDGCKAHDEVMDFLGLEDNDMDVITMSWSCMQI